MDISADVGYYFGMELLSAEKAGEALGISERRVRDLAAQGALAGAFRVGRAWIIPAEAVQAELARRKEPPAEKRGAGRPLKRPEVAQ